MVLGFFPNIQHFAMKSIIENTIGRHLFTNKAVEGGFHFMAFGGITTAEIMTSQFSYQLKMFTQLLN